MKQLKTLIAILVFGTSSVVLANTPGTRCTKGMAIDTTTQELCIATLLFLEARGRLKGLEFIEAEQKCKRRAEAAYERQIERGKGQCPSTTDPQQLADYVNSRTQSLFLPYIE